MPERPEAQGGGARSAGAPRTCVDDVSTHPSGAPSTSGEAEPVDKISLRDYPGGAATQPAVRSDDPDAGASDAGGPYKPLSESSCAVTAAEEGSAAGPAAPPPRPFWKQLLRHAGPGFMVSMAYIDPGNLAADVAQGAAAGYALAWVTLWCSVAGYVIQILSAKLGCVTGGHLAQHCAAEYPKATRLALWAAAELGVAAVDMMETLGGAVALRTLSSGAIPLPAGVAITAAGGFTLLALERWGVRVMEAALAAIIAGMAGAFAYMFFAAGVDYGALAVGLAVPKLSGATIPYAVGAVGAIIMPHNLYLHSDLVLEKPHARGAATPVGQAMRLVRVEAAAALTVALGINIAVIAVFGAAFGPGAVEDPAVAAMGTCEEVGLGNAGDCLGAAFGAAFAYLWGAGLLAAALASAVTSTYAGQVILTGMLGVRVGEGWRVAGVRFAALAPALLLAAFLRDDAQLADTTEALNIVQSLVLPFVVIPLLTFTSSRRIMGAPHANRPWAVAALGLGLAFLVGLNGYLAVAFALDRLPQVAWAQALFGVGCCVYVAFGVYLAAGPRRVGAVVARGAKAAAARSRPVMSRAVDMMEVHV